MPLTLRLRPEKKSGLRSVTGVVPIAIGISPYTPIAIGATAPEKGAVAGYRFYPSRATQPIVVCQQSFSVEKSA